MFSFLSPSLEYLLHCPRRFRLEKVRRERVLAPFASSELGILVHRRIADSLRKNIPADVQPFGLPRRVLLQQGEALDELVWRAHSSLDYYNRECRPRLKGQRVCEVEYYVRQSYPSSGHSVTVSGILDLVLESSEGDMLIDWKTGSIKRSETQLKFYLMLRYLETRRVPRQAEAVSLSSGESLCIRWDESLPAWFEAKVKGMRESLEVCKIDTPKPGWHCTYCPYAHSCEVSEAPPRQVLDTFTGELISYAQT